MRLRASRMLAATLVLVGATSCGSGGSSTTERPAVRERGGGETTAAPSAIATIKRAIATSRNAGTAQYLGSFFFDAGELGTEDPAEGSVSLANDTADYTVDMRAETEGLVPPGTPGEQVRLQVREVAGQLYLRFPAAFESAGVGSRWVEVPAAAEPSGAVLPPGFEEVSLRVFLAARLLRPETCLELLDSATSARLVGPETVREKQTTRYGLEWAPRKWVEDNGLFFFFGNDRSPERLATLDNVFDQATIADVWIDELGRIRRIIAAADLTLIAPYFDPPGDPKMWRELRTKCEFFDYGTEVPAINPPSNVVTPRRNG